jgi:phospholipase A-2-activating protein
LNVQTLPDVNDRDKFTGKKKGEIRLFRNGTSPEVHVWNMEEQKWEKMGDVMGPAPQQKDFYEGDEFFPAGDYDYIFNIDIKSKGEKKLPFNKGSIPLEEAEKFVEREQIHKVFVEEISGFIRNELDKVNTYGHQQVPEPIQMQAAPSIPVEEKHIEKSISTGKASKVFPMVCLLV